MTAPTGVARDVFVNGWYASHFRPDDHTDPFRALYSAKRRDVLAMFESKRAARDVIDLGGGRGRIAVPLARRHRVTLCDISQDMLDIAVRDATAEGIPHGHLLASRLDASEPLPFASGQFEDAIALDLLVHVARPVETLLEVRRVLRPGGRLVVDTTNRAPWWTLRYPGYIGRHPRRWVQTLRNGGVLPEWQRIVRHHTAAEFQTMLAESGFTVVRRRHYGPSLCPKWFLFLCE